MICPWKIITTRNYVCHYCLSQLSSTRVSNKVPPRDWRFTVVPFGSHRINPAPFLLMEAFLELFFWKTPQLSHRIHLDVLNILKSSSFKMGFDFWKEEKVTRVKIWRIQWLVDLGDAVLGQKLLHRCAVMVQLPLTGRMQFWTFVMNVIPQMLQ